MINQFNSLTLLRVVGLVSVACIPAYRFLFPEDATDPMWQRLALSGIIFLLVAGSLLSAWVKKRAIPLAYALSLIITVWAAELVALNDFDPQYTTSYVILLFFCGVIITKRKWLLAMTLLNFATGCVIAVLCWSTELPFFQFLGMLGFVLLMINLLLILRLRDQDKLATSESHFRSIAATVFATSKDAILITDANRTPMEFNKAFLDLWGLKKEMMENGQGRQRAAQASQLLLDPDSFFAPLPGIKAKPDLETFDILRFRDGRIIERTSRPFIQPDVPSGRIWIYHDITELKQAEQKTQRTSSILEATFDASVMGIIVVNKKNRPLIFNQKFLNIWKISEERMESLRPDEIRAELWEQTKNPEEVEASILRILKGEDEGEKQIIRFKDGRIVERYHRNIIEGGHHAGRIWFYLDITEEATARDELIQRNFELDSFVYRASHDLKAPLNSIMGLIGILEGDEISTNTRKMLGLMNKSAVKLDTFIRNLADFSRNAKLETLRESIQLKEIVDEILQGLKFMDQASDTTFQIDIQEGLEFQSDPVRLNIVLSNLISNAIKYQDLAREEKKVIIRAHCPDDTVLIEVEDNGIGIPEKHKKTVFDLFVRASIQSYGSGIGLYITRNAAERIGGTLSFTSEEGKGTHFKLLIPKRAPASTRAVAPSS